MATPTTQNVQRPEPLPPATSSALDRIVLAEGYPWANGTGPKYFEITMKHKAQCGINLPMNWPPALWGVDVAKYRLVLERVDAAPNDPGCTRHSPNDRTHRREAAVGDSNQTRTVAAASCSVQ